MAEEILKFELPAIKKIAKKSFTERDLGDFKYGVNGFYKKNHAKIRKLFEEPDHPEAEHAPAIASFRQ